MSGDVAVVIVNYRTKELTCDAVESVVGEPGVREIVVVDNGSDDGSAAHFKKVLDDSRVRIVESVENLGFGCGVNLGVEHCRAPLLFLLNSDAVLLPGSLSKLTATLLERPSVAVVAPAVYWDGSQRELQAGAHGVFPTLKVIALRRNTHPPETLSPDWVSAVAMMMRRRDFDSIGGFDPDFVMYLEDVDLCRRFRAAGKGVRRELSAGVVHRLARSWSSIAAAHGRDDLALPERSAQQSRVLYFRKAGFSRTERLAVQVIRMFHLARQWSSGRSPRAHRKGR